MTVGPAPFAEARPMDLYPQVPQEPRTDFVGSRDAPNDDADVPGALGVSPPTSQPGFLFFVGVLMLGLGGLLAIARMIGC